MPTKATPLKTKPAPKGRTAPLAPTRPKKASKPPTPARGVVTRIRHDAASAPTLDRPSKQAQLIAALRSTPGATIAELITLTGWQAHTIRGTMSGVLRKRLGLTVTCDVRDSAGQRRYQIQPAADA